MNDPLGVKLLSYLSLPGVKLLSCLSLQFSYLNEHKFRYSFSDINNPMCVWVCLWNWTWDHIFFLCTFILLFLLKGLNSSITSLRHFIEPNISYAKNKDLAIIHLWCPHESGMWGRGLVLTFVTCLWILFLSNQSIVNFCRRWE